MTVEVYSYNPEIDYAEIAKITIFEIHGVKIEMKDGRVFRYRK